MLVAVGLLAAYLVGSFPSAYIIGRRIKDIDIRQHGSGNMGAANAQQVLGWRAATVVFLLDLFKGILAVYLGIWVGADPLLMASAAVAGHCYPVWLRFKGGKGLATALGAIIIIGSPWSILVFAAGWMLMLAYYRIAAILAQKQKIAAAPDASKFSDRANILGICTLMMFALLSGPDWWLALLTAIIFSRLTQSLISITTDEH